MATERLKGNALTNRSWKSDREKLENRAGEVDI